MATGRDWGMIRGQLETRNSRDSSEREQSKGNKDVN